MYNPLVEIKHSTGAITFVRSSKITEIIKRREDNKPYGDWNWSVKTESNTYLNVINIVEIIDIVYSVENRNELMNSTIK